MTGAPVEVFAGLLEVLGVDVLEGVVEVFLAGVDVLEGVEVLEGVVEDFLAGVDVLEGVEVLEGVVELEAAAAPETSTARARRLKNFIKGLLRHGLGNGYLSDHLPT